MHLVVTGAMDDLAVVQYLAEQGIGSTPLSAHFIGEAVQKGLVLGFANAGDEDMDRCITALRTALAFRG